jgi:HK97 family phage major capsid protein
MTDYNYLNATLNNDEGKYTVPAPLAKQIIDNVYRGSGMLQLLRKWPMGSVTESIPLLSSGSTAAYTSAEGGAKGNTQPVFGQITLTAKELAAVVVTTELLLKTSNLENIAGVIQEDLVNAFITAKEKEYAGYGGSVYTHDISSYVPEAHTIAAGTGDDIVVDISNALAAIEEHIVGNPRIAFCTHPAIRAQLRNLRSATDKLPIFQPANGNAPDTLFGYPIYYSGNFEKTGSPSGYEMFVADWNKVIEGNLQGLQIAKSNEATITLADTTTVNLWQQNMVAIKAWLYSAFEIADANILAKVTGLGI